MYLGTHLVPAVHCARQGKQQSTQSTTVPLFPRCTLPFELHPHPIPPPSHVRTTTYRTFPGPSLAPRGQERKPNKECLVPDSIASLFLPLPSLTPLEGVEPSLPEKVRPSRCFSLPPNNPLTLCRATLPISFALSTPRQELPSTLRSATEKNKHYYISFFPA